MYATSAAMLAQHGYHSANDPKLARDQKFNAGYRQGLRAWKSGRENILDVSLATLPNGARRDGYFAAIEYASAAKLPQY